MAEDVPSLIARILMENSTKNFVQRIMQPDLYPTLDLGNNQSGTHKLGWGQIGNDYIVFPEIIQQPGQWNLRQLPPQDAFNYALQNNEYLKFKSPEEAEWFTTNYKKMWGY